MQPEAGNRKRVVGNEIWQPDGRVVEGILMLQTFSAFRKGSNIAHRLLIFASEVLRVARALPSDAATKHIAMQIMRSATAVGANYEEARAAESAPDFIHKVSVANKELRETLWWLALIDTAQLTPTTNLEQLAREGSELASILTASIRTARKNQTNEQV